ncbi:putative protein DP96R, partial [Dissostichus eleginoides]
SLNTPEKQSGGREIPDMWRGKDRGLERPHISGCCQAGVRGRDSKGQLFATRRSQGSTYVG